MADIVEFQLEGGGAVQIEASEVAAEGVQRVSKGKRTQVRKAKEKFEEVIGVVQPLANAILGRLKGLAEPADEVTVEFALKVGGEMKFIVSSAAADATFKIGLKWGKK